MHIDDQYHTMYICFYDQIEDNKLVIVTNRFMVFLNKNIIFYNVINTSNNKDIVPI